jgi:predicted nucleic acid-binding protein
MFAGYVIDTNIHAAYLLQGYEADPLTKKYLAFYSKIPLSQRLVPDFIMNEFELFITQVAPAKYRMSGEQATSFYKAVTTYLRDIATSFTLLTTPLEAYKIAFSLYEQNTQHRHISFTDSLLVALAKQQDFLLLTKDRRLQTIAKELQVGYFDPKFAPGLQ